MTNDELKTSARSAANVEFVIRVEPGGRRRLGRRWSSGSCVTPVPPVSPAGAFFHYRRSGGNFAIYTVDNFARAAGKNFAARQGNFAYLRQEAHAALTSLSRLDAKFCLASYRFRGRAKFGFRRAKLTAVAVSEIAAVGSSDRVPQPCGLPFFSLPPFRR